MAYQAELARKLAAQRIHDGGAEAPPAPRASGSFNNVWSKSAVGGGWSTVDGTVGAPPPPVRFSSNTTRDSILNIEVSSGIAGDNNADDSLETQRMDP